MSLTSLPSVALPSALVGAVISASVAVVVVLVTQIWTSIRARRDRRYAARRQALTEAQDAAHLLRTALRRYGRHLQDAAKASPVGALVSPEIPPEIEDARDEAQGRFLVTISRVEDTHIESALRDWEEVARVRFLDVSDVTATVEEAWFHYVQSLAGAALRSPACKTTTRQRAKLQKPARVDLDPD